MHHKAMAEIKDALSSCLMEPLMHSLITSGELKKLSEKIKSRKSDPYSVAEEITQRFLKKESQK
jgi:LAO/AO transport system kinase